MTANETYRDYFLELEIHVVILADKLRIDIWKLLQHTTTDTDY